jgi:hypothetical protein
VGKGTAGRAWDHLKANARNYNPKKEKAIKSIRRAKFEPIVSIKKTGLTNLEAFRLERELVLKIGRLDLKTGFLTNLNDGGLGGPSNRIRSKEELEQQSANYWNMNEDRRKEIAEKRSKTFNSKSEREKKLFSKKLRAAHAQRDEKVERKRAKAIASKTSSYWASLTDEQRAERRRKISEGRRKHWQSLSEAQRRKKVAEIQRSTQSYHANLSSDERRKRSERNRNAALTRYT